jgi:hypothetical protein
MRRLGNGCHLACSAHHCSLHEENVVGETEGALHCASMYAMVTSKNFLANELLLQAPSV